MDADAHRAVGDEKPAQSPIIPVSSSISGTPPRAVEPTAAPQIVEGAGSYHPAPPRYEAPLVSAPATATPASAPPPAPQPRAARALTPTSPQPPTPAPPAHEKLALVHTAPPDHEKEAVGHIFDVLRDALGRGTISPVERAIIAGAKVMLKQLSEECDLALSRSADASTQVNKSRRSKTPARKKSGPEE